VVFVCLGPKIIEFLKTEGLIYIFFWGGMGGRIGVDVLVLYTSLLSMQFLDFKGEKYIIQIC
jgi:hypothetical protein